jgi:hypothetical protein
MNICQIDKIERKAFSGYPKIEISILQGAGQIITIQFIMINSSSIYLTEDLPIRDCTEF